MYPSFPFEEFVAAARRGDKLRRSEAQRLGLPGSTPSVRLFWRGTARFGMALARLGSAVEGLGARLQGAASRADLGAVGMNSAVLTTEARR